MKGKKKKRKKPNNWPFRSPTGFACFPFPPLEQIKSVKKIQGCLGFFFSIGKTQIFQYWQYIQECRSEIVLGKKSSVECNSHTWIDHLCFISENILFPIFFFFLHLSISFLWVISGILIPLLHIFIFSYCKIRRQEFLANRPLGYSKWNLNSVQGFATALLACMTSHFISVSLFPSPWNGNGIWSHWLSTLISMIKGSVEKLGFIICMLYTKHIL